MIKFVNYTGNKLKVLKFFFKRTKISVRLINAVIFGNNKHLTALERGKVKEYIMILISNNIPNLFYLKDYITAIKLEYKFYRFIGLALCDKAGCLMYQAKWLAMLITAPLRIFNKLALCDKCHKKMEVLYVSFISGTKERI